MNGDEIATFVGCCFKHGLSKLQSILREMIMGIELALEESEEEKDSIDTEEEDEEEEEDDDDKDDKDEEDDDHEEEVPRKKPCRVNDLFRGTTSPPSNGQQDRAGASGSKRLYTSASTANCSALCPTKRSRVLSSSPASAPSSVSFPAPLTSPSTSSDSPASPLLMCADESVICISSDEEASTSSRAHPHTFGDTAAFVPRSKSLIKKMPWL